MPKISAMSIVDLVKKIAPGMPIQEIGIRPGEKLHEVMCPKEDSRLTLEFDDHYVICPSIQFSHFIDFTTNALGERGTPVADGFEYNSSTTREVPDAMMLEEMLGA